MNLIETDMIATLFFSLDRCPMLFKILVYIKNISTLRSPKFCKYKFNQNLMEREVDDMSHQPWF